MKQDLNGVRTAQDLERKYDFSSLLGLKRAVIQNETGLTKIENELNNFVISTLSSVENLQDQIDGNITTFYYSGVPNLSNLPASDWKESEYNIHLGDLYYDKDTGYAYRFYLDSENNKYGWIQIKDSDVVEALSLANAANDTADSKRRVFIEEPKPPYDSGDLWLKDEELYVCQISKKEGNYEDGDFIIATKYTDNTYAEQVNNTLTVFSGKVTKELSDTNARIDIVETATTINGEDISTLKTRSTEIEANLEGINASVSKIDKLEKNIQTSKKTTTYPIEIKDAGAYPVNELNLYGNSNQETTKGKNIFDYITNLTTPTYGLTSTLNKDGSITTIGTPTKTFVFILPSVDITDKLEDGETYKLSKKTSSTDTKLFLQVVATTTSGSKKYYGSDNEASSSFVVDKTTFPRYEICVQTSNTLDPVNETNYYMLCKGIDTDFEQYTGGKASPNSQFPSEIKNIKGIENIFDISKPYAVLLRATIETSKTEIKITNEAGKNYSGVQWLIPTKVGETYTFSVDYINEDSCPLALVIYDNTSVKNRIAISDIVTLKSGKLSVTFIATTDTSYFNFMGNGSDSTNYGGKSVTFKNIQIEKGTTLHSCVPHGAWLPVNVTGKNLLNFNYDRYAWSTGQAITEGSTIKFIGTQALNTSHRINTEFKCFIPKNTKIILSSRIIENANSYVSGWMQLLIRFNYKDGTNDLLGMSFNNKNEATQIKQAIKTLDKDVKSIYAVVGSSGIFSSGDTTSSLTIGMQLEIDDTLSDYEPHKENQFLINMNTYDDESNIIGYHELSKINNIRDELKVISGKFNKKIGKYIFTGNENINFEPSISRIFIRKEELDNLGINLIYVTTENEIPNIKSNKFSATTFSNLYNNKNSDNVFALSSSALSLKNKKWTTINEAKQDLKGTTIYYELETPEQIQLTPTTIELFEGYNRITIEDENQLVEEVEMTYPTDSRLNGQYATKTELKLTSDSITSEVNKKVSADNFNSTVEDISNKMTQTANRTDSTIQEILSVNNEQNVKINSLTQTTDGLNINISEQQKLYDSLNGKLVEIEGTLKNMSFDFSTKGLAIATSTDPNNSLLDNTGIKVYNYTKLTAIFNNKGSGIDKLIVTTTAQIGYLKIVKSTKNGKPVTKIYHLKKLIESLGDLE